MNGITAILFDVDGTLLDTGEFILQATEHALAEMGYPVPERKDIAKNVGKGFPEYYFSLTGSHEHTEELIEKHRAFQYKNFHLAKLFPNTLETIKYLKEKGYKLGAVTTRSKKTSHQTLVDAGLFDLFDVVISNEDASELKPSPVPLLKALEHLGDVASSAAMVGDSYLDVQAGINAGIKTIRVKYGFHKDRLHDPEPDFFIDDIKELKEMFP